MTMYCTCETCKRFPGKPHGSQQDMEQIDGLFVMMEPGWTLVHWGDALFYDLYSTEIHRFVHLGNQPMVGASFYLFTGPVPVRPPKQLGLLGIGGHYRYSIDDWVLGNEINAFYKNDGPKAHEGTYREVAVALGCGGSIRFNGARKGVSYGYTGTRPSS